MKKTTIKQLLFIFALLLGTMNAWADPVGLTNRTTPNNELFYHSKAFGVTYGGTIADGYSHEYGWSLTKDFNTRKLRINTNNALAEGDIISIEFKTEGTNSNVMKIFLEDNGSAESVVSLTKSGMAASEIYTVDYTIPAASELIGKTTLYLGKAGNNKYIRKVVITRTGADDLRPNTLTGISKSWDFEGFNNVTTTEDIVNNDLFYKTGVNLTTKSSGTYTKAVELATDKYLTFWVPTGTGKVELVCSSGNDRNIRAKVGNAAVVTLGSVHYSQKIYTLGYSVTEATPITLSGDGTNRCYIHAINVSMGQETVTLNATYPYATYSCVNDIDVDKITASTGTVTVYKASSSDASKVTLESVTGKVPAGTGLVLKGTPGATITIPYTTGASALEGINLLQAVNQSGSLTSSADPSGTATTGTNYVLSVQSGSVVFASISSDEATMKAGQAYLNVPAGARTLSISFEDETTGIRLIDNGKQTIDNSVYDLSGRRVTQPTKGLYIVNGRKVVIK